MTSDFVKGGRNERGVTVESDGRLKGERCMRFENGKRFTTQSLLKKTAAPVRWASPKCLVEQISLCSTLLGALFKKEKKEEEKKESLMISPIASSS